MRPKQSGYMYWAKTQSQARYNLATSGVAPYPFRELPFHCEQFALQGDNNYGYVPPSMANYLAMATLLDPGDEVLIEQPAYNLLVDAARRARWLRRRCCARWSTLRAVRKPACW